MTKERHVNAKAQNALQVLRSIGAAPSHHTLNPAQVDQLLDEARRVRYQKPKNANGSRGRYFYQKLQREAGRQAVRPS